MKTSILVRIMFLTLFLSSSAWAQDVGYSKVGMYVEKGRNIATNYAAGVCYPANSKFLILKTSKKEIEVRDEKSGQKFTIVNVPDYTGKNIATLREMLFSPTKLTLSEHSSKVLEAVNKCHVDVGMTKDEVILARGYPPVHKTPSLNSDAWRYWRMRYDTGVVHFENNKVARIDEKVDPN